MLLTAPVEPPACPGLNKILATSSVKNFVKPGGVLPENLCGGVRPPLYI